jgi:shikimate kinase
MNVILFGFKKCGKTYYGMKVAQKLHMDFIESDLLLEKIYEAKHHKFLSYRDIGKKHGFAFFQTLEEEVVSLLLQKKNTVISLGGGVVLNEENVKRLEKIGPLVYLEVPKKELKERILSSDLPPYLDPKHPSESFDAFYEEKAALYKRISSHTLSVTDKEEETLERLSSFIEHLKSEKKRRHLHG